MKLQLALDVYDTPQALTLLEGLADVVDIVEIGTPMIIREGLRAVKAVKLAHPNATVLADVKIMDGGTLEAAYAFEAGADIVTVLAVAEDATIRNVVAAANKFGRRVMADMIAVRDIEERAAVLDGFGLDFLCVHTAFDIQATGKSPLDGLKRINSVIERSKAAVAGGIKLATLPGIAAQRPAIVVVGMGITGQTDPRAAAEQMKKIMEEACA